MREVVGLETEKRSARSLIEYSPVACMRQSSPGAGIWDEPCQPVEFRQDQRVALAHSGEGQHYRVAVLNLFAAIVMH